MATNSSTREDDIYLREDRSTKPKEVFKITRDVIAAGNHQTGAAVLDVGCATGELIQYLNAEFPDFDFSGVDYSSSLIEEANRREVGANFFVGDILDAKSLGTQRYDVITCHGVLAHFDEADLCTALKNLVGLSRDSATICIHGQFNDFPIDVEMRYRLTTADGPGDWEYGWNMFSRTYVDRFLSSLPHKLSWGWSVFEMPFEIERRDDVMRAWTIKTEDNPFQRVNGARQLVHTEFLNITVDSLSGE